MARPKAAKNLSPEELKQKRDGLRVMLKQAVDNQKATAKEAEAVRKTYEATLKEAAKVFAAAEKAHKAAVASATKTYETAAKKAQKAVEAANAGHDKVSAQLAALNPVAAVSPEAAAV